MVCDWDHHGQLYLLSYCILDTKRDLIMPNTSFYNKIKSSN